MLVEEKSVFHVSAEYPEDLWERDHQLPLSDDRANATEIPELNGWKGAGIFTHQGFARRHYSTQQITYGLYTRSPKSFSHQENIFYNAYEKDIAILNIFFGDSTVFGELPFQEMPFK